MRALCRLRHLAAHLARKIPPRAEDESCFLPSATPQNSAKIIRSGTPAPIMRISQGVKSNKLLFNSKRDRTPRTRKWICGRATNEARLKNFNQRARGGVKRRNPDTRLAEMRAGKTRALSGARLCLPGKSRGKRARAGAD